jgi:phosphohistidine phosphatase
VSFEDREKRAPMRTLLILRHAKSSWKDASLPDHERPLNKRGRRDAPRVGRRLRDEGLTPDLILCSTARRARDTAEAVAEASGYEGEIESRPDLYMADSDAYLHALRGLPDDYERVMVVGHNPGLEELLEALTGEVEALPTAALAQVELGLRRWRDLDDESEGRLVSLWRPRESK